MKDRQISQKMLQALQSGVLHPLLELIHHDQTLDMELRGNFINIYYRGGSLFTITEIKEENDSSFTIYFNSTGNKNDKGYCNSSLYKAKGRSPLPDHPSLEKAVQNIPLYKQAMDWYFSENPNLEREIQQEIVTENNNHSNISYGTDYYIVDIEYANSENNSRFDMVAIKWPSTSNGRQDGKEATLALIELKYGDGSIKGDAGVEKHLQDSDTFLSASEKFSDFCSDMAQVFKQKCKLGLINGIKEDRHPTITTNNPELIFIFANHKPASQKLKEEVKKLRSQCIQWNIYYATASAMGYGLYANQMKDIDKFLKALDQEPIKTAPSIKENL